MHPLRSAVVAAFLLPVLLTGLHAQQVTGQDFDQILERADKLLEEAKVSYENARSQNAAAAFVDAGFKLEDARIKFIVLQEIGSPEKQKVAADRLRAVNQLSKLIHDGRVAITGRAAESPAAKPSDPVPDAPKDPSANPDSPVAKAAVDVSKRAPVPDAAKQRESERLVKDLFKDQYAKKAPSDRKMLARLLLGQAAKSSDDISAQWVLYREAQDAAVQSCDIKSAIEAIEATARVFDIDSLSMRNTALTNAGKAAKTPEEYGSVTEALLSLLGDFVRADQFDAADKVAVLAAQQARKSGNQPLLAQATSHAKDVAEAKSLFQAMKSVMETQAKNPDDPGANVEIGRFLCFVKGSWDSGLRFLVKGSDAALKTLAEKELALSTQAGDRASLADAWSDLAQKDKSPLRKSQLLAHARTIYESALPDATSLLRARIEKRLSELPASAVPAGPGGKAVDLLAMIDPAKDQISGKWAMNGKTLVSPKTRIDRLEIPYSPPAEYDLRFVLEKSGSDVFNIGLSDGKNPFTVTFDQAAGGYTTMGRAKYSGEAIPREMVATILCQVRSSGVKVMVNGKVIVESSDPIESLGCNGPWRTPNPKALSIGSFETEFRISEISLIPISGQGKKLR
jgi:hypothetical protein